jgi:hypothetical protein
MKTSKLNNKLNHVQASRVHRTPVELSYQAIDGHHDQEKLAQCTKELLEISTRDFIRQHYVPHYKNLLLLKNLPEYHQFMLQDSIQREQNTKYAFFHVTYQKKSKNYRFIREHRKKNSSSSRFHGQIIHINIGINQIDLAFDAIRPVLFSEESPIFDWSLSDNSSKTSGQIILYVTPNQDRHRFSIDKIAELTDFLWRIEVELIRFGIQPGEVPKGDIQSKAWSYCSYCDERIVSLHHYPPARHTAYEQDPLFYLIAFSAQNRSKEPIAKPNADYPS